MTTLVLSSRHTADGQALWRAAVRRGWSTARVRGLEVPVIDDPDVVLYVEALFAPHIAEQLGRLLIDPPEDWLVRLPRELTRRRVELTTLGAARAMAQPAFVKPPNDKTFTARVFENGSALPVEYADDTAVLVADPVSWRAEYRCFCLDGRVLTASPYLLDGIHAAEDDYNAPPDELAAAEAFAESVLADPRVTTPAAVVIDVGMVVDEGWAVVEANGAWGSGIYGCDPDAVLDVIRRATVAE